MSSVRILVADDEEPVRRLLTRMLDGPERTVAAAADGVEAMGLAVASAPDLIVLDVNMPRMNGWEVLAELRRCPLTRLVPVIILTSRAGIADKVDGLGLGADDYVTKPFSRAELLARVESLLRRQRLSLSVNPLTGLPGSPAIEEEVERRIRGGRAFALFHVDIDRFKSYNDAHGFADGDQVLLATASILRECVGGGFAGHVGGDDFAAVTALAEAPHAAQRLVTLFDERAPSFYDPVDRARGWTETTDRFGAPRRAPLLTLSVGIASTAARPLSCYAQAAQIASEMKSYLKSGPERALSRFEFDRGTR